VVVYHFYSHNVIRSGCPKGSTKARKISRPNETARKQKAKAHEYANEDRIPLSPPDESMDFLLFGASLSLVSLNTTPILKDS